MFRPQRLVDFVGQETVKNNIQVCIDAYKRNPQGRLNHVLLIGQPGSGKTTLSKLIATEMGTSITEFMGPQITFEDLDCLNDQEVDSILFIDEIHSIPIKIEEALYSAMEDFVWNGNRISQFTLIGATTKEGLLSKPFHSRFGIIETLDVYLLEDLERIVKNSANLLKISIEESAVREIAIRSRGIPRLVNHYLQRVANYAIDGRITLDITKVAFNCIGIDQYGLDRIDRKILTAMYTTFKDKPVGIKSLSNVLGEDSTSIELLREPYLIDSGLMYRSERGRLLTEKGIKYAKELIGI